MTKPLNFWAQVEQAARDIAALRRPRVRKLGKQPKKYPRKIKRVQQ